MWHEARKHEKMIRGMMVDYQRRAERRRDFYEKVKKDPHSFLVIYGSSAKIHIDADLAQQAENCMMNWQSESIDRFDGRSQLDFFQEHKPDSESEPLSLEERRLNYERYRILVQNDCSNTEESEFLHQIETDEKTSLDRLKEKQKKAKEEKAKLAQSKVAIAFTYNDSTAPTAPGVAPKRWDSNIVKRTGKGGDRDSDDSSESSDEGKQDLDVTINLNVLSKEELAGVNHAATFYGMGPNDFNKFLKEDKREDEELVKMKEQEEEKAQFSGRHCRRERRVFKERKLAERAATGDLSGLPSFAVPIVEKEGEEDEDEDESSSLSSGSEERVEYISSFGEAGGQMTSTETSGTVCQATTSGIEPVVIGPMPPPADFKPETVESASPVKKPADLKRKPDFVPTRRGSPPTSSKSMKKPGSGPYRRRKSSTSSSSSSSPARRQRSRSPLPRRRNDSDDDRLGSTRRSRSSDRRRYRRSTSRDDRRRRDRRKSSSSSSSTSTTSSSSTSSSSTASSSSSSRHDRRQQYSPRRRSKSRSRSRSPRSSYRKDDSKKSSSSNTPTPSTPGGNSSSLNKSKQMSMQDIMRQRVQQALAKQCKADKKADREKRERQAREEFERQEQLAKMSHDLQRRDDERRRQEMEAANFSSATSVAVPPVMYQTSTSSSEPDADNSDLYYPPLPAERKRRHRSRSRSRSSSH